SALHNYARKRCAIGFERSEHRTAQNDKFSPPGWKVLHGDFRSHLPHGIFVTFQKKKRIRISLTRFVFVKEDFGLLRC
ncbi:hypothetical protein, partial [Escherichia coli]|uniref:hypothetical protein n=1 Tax=Escherichia coli TaxID=562 RepID=UPI001BC859C0